MKNPMFDPEKILADFAAREVLTNVLNIADPDVAIDIKMHAIVDICTALTGSPEGAAHYGGIMTGMIMMLGECDGAKDHLDPIRAQVQEAARKDGR